MIVRSLSAALLALSICGTGLPSARAADIAAQRDLVNGGIVGLISGGVTGTYVRIAADVADALDEGYQLRNQNPSPPAGEAAGPGGVRAGQAIVPAATETFVASDGGSGA